MREPAHAWVTYSHCSINSLFGLASKNAFYGIALASGLDVGDYNSAIYTYIQLRLYIHKPKVISGVSKEFPPGKCLLKTRVLWIISSSLISKTDSHIALREGSLEI